MPRPPRQRHIETIREMSFTCPEGKVCHSRKRGLAERLQIGRADIGPFRLRPDVDEDREASRKAAEKRRRPLSLLHIRRGLKRHELPLRRAPRIPKVLSTIKRSRRSLPERICQFPITPNHCPVPRRRQVLKSFTLLFTNNTTSPCFSLIAWKRKTMARAGREATDEGPKGSGTAPYADVNLNTISCVCTTV